MVLVFTRSDGQCNVPEAVQKHSFFVKTARLCSDDKNRGMYLNSSAGAFPCRTKEVLYAFDEQKVCQGGRRPRISIRRDGRGARRGRRQPASTCKNVSLRAAVRGCRAQLYGARTSCSLLQRSYCDMHISRVISHAKITTSIPADSTAICSV